MVLAAMIVAYAASPAISGGRGGSALSVAAAM
jgi:hypothetical protein